MWLGVRHDQQVFPGIIFLLSAVVDDGNSNWKSAPNLGLTAETVGYGKIYASRGTNGNEDINTVSR